MELLVWLGSTLLLLAGTFAVTRAGTRAILALPLSTSRRVLSLYALDVLAIWWSLACVVAILIHANPFVTVGRALGIDAYPPAVWTVLLSGTITAMLIGSEYAFRRGQRPAWNDLGLRSRFDPGYGLGPAYRSRMWVADGLFTFTAALSLFGLWELGVELVWWVPLVVCLFFVYSALLHPLGNGSYSRVREPGEDERSRIEDCYELIGRDPARTFVFDDPDGHPGVAVLGRGDLRTLWVGERVLERASDDSLAVAIAQAEERNRRHVYLYPKAGPALVLAGGFLFLASVLHGGLLLFAVGIAGMVVGIAVLLAVNRLLRRITHAVDRHVAAEFGPAVVRTALERVGRETLVIDPETLADNWIAARLGPEAPIDDRIDRLERAFEPDGGEDARDGASRADP